MAYSISVILLSPMTREHSLKRKDLCHGVHHANSAFLMPVLEYWLPPWGTAFQVMTIQHFLYCGYRYFQTQLPPTTLPVP